MNLIKTVAVTTAAEGGSARPEIVATSDRVFVLYLGNIAAGGNRTFSLKIYDPGLDTVIASRTLVSTTPEYGGPTDIRVCSESPFLYAFYETHKPTSLTTALTYLWGAKYALTDSFDRLASTPAPIATSRPMSELPAGGELLDDPAPLVKSDTVFVVTRLKYSLAMAGSTIYRVRAFNQDDLTPLAQFDLDLSAAADGRGRVASLLLRGGAIDMALPTTVSDAGLNESNDDGALSDIVLVRMRPDWTFDPGLDVRTIAAAPDDVENYVTGLDEDGLGRIYVTHKQSIGRPPQGTHIAWIKVYDDELNLLGEEEARRTVWGPGGGEVRPSLEVAGARIFSGQSTGESLGSGQAEIRVYELASTGANVRASPGPTASLLAQSYPNPLGLGATIRFSIAERSRVTLRVFDALGRLAATLADEEMSPGVHAVHWEAGGLPSGVYFYRLAAGALSTTRRLEVLR